MSENKGKFTREAAEAYLAHEPEMEAEKLSPQVWTISDGVCRSIFLEGDNSVIAFDTFGTPGKARAYKNKVAECIPGKAIKTIIYSHDHLDHCIDQEDATMDRDELKAISRYL